MTNRNKFINKLNKYMYTGNLNIITMNGTTVASISYINVVQDEEDKDIVYLAVDNASTGYIWINYKAIKYIREFDDCIEITVE
ncbi:MAG: hypothetical protein RR406_00010 [Bacilli bacterium]